jgi:hypothetical protein
MDEQKNPREEQLRRIAENAARAQGKEVEGESSDAPEAASSEKPEVDLDDPVTQEKILHPDGTDVELSYGTIKIYPPSAMVGKMAWAFCQEIITDVLETKPTTREVFAIRVLSKIMGTVPPQMRLYRLIAYMLGKPGIIDEKTALQASTELAEKTSSDDVAILFERLSVGARIGKPRSATAKK